MCIIAYKQKGMPLFEEKTIRQMFKRNPDGAGIMFCENDKVIVKKGFMNVEELLNELGKKEWTDKNLILHFRIGTSGLNDELNCHPYPVFDSNAIEFTTNLAMAHNGILHKYAPSYGSKINDTQIFIRNVLAKLDEDFIYDDDVMFLIEELIGTNKLIFLNSEDEVRMIGNFIYDNGFYYSNNSYKERVIDRKFQSFRIIDELELALDDLDTIDEEIYGLK